MIRLSKVFAAVLCGMLVAAVGAGSALTASAWPRPSMIRRANYIQNPQDNQQSTDDQQSKQEKKRQRREPSQPDAAAETATPPAANKPAGAKISSEFGDTVDIIAD